MLHLFFNDLSLVDEPCAFEVAVVRLRGLVQVLRQATRLAPRLVLNAARPVAELSFGRNWPLAALRNQAGCREEGMYLKRIVDRAPFTLALDERPVDAAGGAEYRLSANAEILAGKIALALGLAHDLDGLAISLPTHQFWQSRRVPIDRLSLNNETEVVVVEVQARNACTADDVEHHRDALLSAMRPAVHDGRELWAQRALLFRSLRFIPRTRAQLESLQHGNPVLASVVDKLVGLDRAVEAWKQTGLALPPYPFNVRPESQSRLHLVAFADENGVIRSFSEHADFAPGEGRIHFRLEAQPERHALIGHVDRKLGIG